MSRAPALRSAAAGGFGRHGGKGGAPAGGARRARARPRGNRQSPARADPPGARPGHPGNSTAPPDPNTRKPKFKPPALACDAHCHIFGPAAKFPYAADAPYWPPDAPFEDLQKLHKTLGIERAVIVHASCHGADLRVTLDGIARAQGQYRGTAIIDETYGEREFQKMHDGGIRGVRFNFVKHMPHDGLPGDLVGQMAPEPALQQKILVDNPARLYGF